MTAKTWTLEWANASPGLWVCTSPRPHRYVIMSFVLPELSENPSRVFQVRKVHASIARADPGSFGYLLGEEWTLDDAKALAERDAWSDDQGAACDVPRDFPALALTRFFWRISNGTHRGALAVVREDGRTFARVVGMGRGSADVYEPGVCAELEITPAMMAGEASGPVSDPCRDCGAAGGEPHEDGCDVARCMETGLQRLACGGGHDCGQQVWTGQWPGVAECREYGWYSRFTDRGWQRCAAGDPDAVEDLTRLLMECDWDREAMRWVRRTWP